MKYKLSDIFELQMGKTPERNNKEFWDDGTEAWISISDIGKCHKYIENTSEKITQTAVNESGIKVIPKDTVIMSFKLSIGKVAITAREMYSNEAIMAFINKGIVHITPTYLYYLLKQKNWDVGTNKAVLGKTLNKATLSQISINIHNADEQMKIVDVLDKVSSVIENRKQQLVEMDNLVKARFVEMFGDIANCSKYDGIALGTICTTLSGGTPTTKVPEYYEGEIPWISTPYLGSNHIDGSSAKAYITEDAIENSATHLIPANTILFGIRVGVGKSSVIDVPMCANQDIVALMGIDTTKFNLIFLKHVLDSYQNHFDSIKKGATILGITTDDLKKVLVPTVEIEIQNQFEVFVEQIDKSKVIELKRVS